MLTLLERKRIRIRNATIGTTRKKGLGNTTIGTIRKD